MISSAVGSSIIVLIVALAVLCIIYILFKWILGIVAKNGISTGPTLQIGNIVFGVIAVVLVLRFLLTLI